MFARRFLLAPALAIAFLVLAAVAGCGRSNLDDYTLPDGGGPGDGSGDSMADSAVDSPVDSSPDVSDSSMPEVVTCSFATCPQGCCDTNGVCQTGGLLTQCGRGGEACQNCQAEGFSVCDPIQHGCGNVVPVCNFSTCNGCCMGNTCFSGTDATECGAGGQACENCQSGNPVEACVNQQCVQQTGCSAATCSGCCAGNTCLPGNSSTACGIKGQQCVSCLAVGETCGPFGQCQTGQTCNPSTCPGCCLGNTCVPGNIDPQCGFAGMTCQNCLQFGETCQGNQCVGTGPCSPATCPFGCCQGNLCVGGNVDTACGVGGGQCQDCAIFGETCQAQACTTFNPCNPSSCPFGCCLGTTCTGGTSQSACGTGGTQCQNCAPLGDTCQGQTCVGKGPCSPATCPFGCCQGNTCVAGASSSACGFGGGQCTNCSAFGEVCQNQACTSPCNPSTCPFGCCQGNACLPGTMDNACGFGGTCQDCTVSGQTCQGQFCQSACNPGNCQGCCDSNQVCQPGFLDSQCGGFGNACTNCTTLSPPSTCNGGLFPPTCASQQMQCPAPYGGCFVPPTQPPFPQPVCSTNDLQNGAAACAGGPFTSACFNFFNFEFSQNPACGQCLQPFDTDFASQTGIFACIAPFVNATCNQETACAGDCQTQSCQQCPDQMSFDMCVGSVGTGQCSSFQGTAGMCEQGAFAGPGAFCNPAKYPDYGHWLQAVGTQYCGGGPIDAGPGG